jgi:hypothetical protein
MQHVRPAVGGQLDELVARIERDEQAAAPAVDGHGAGIAGEVEPASGLDPRAHREHEQRLAARIGDVAPRRRPAIEAGDVRGPHAGRRTADAPPARVAQLDHPLATEENDAAAIGEGWLTARDGPAGAGSSPTAAEPQPASTRSAPPANTLTPPRRPRRSRMAAASHPLAAAPHPRAIVSRIVIFGAAATPSGDQWRLTGRPDRAKVEQ